MTATAAAAFALYAAAASAQVTPAQGYTPPDDTPSIRLGTTFGSAVATANSAFSRAMVWMMFSTTALRKTGNWRASGSPKSSFSWSTSEMVACGLSR